MPACEVYTRNVSLRSSCKPDAINYYPQSPASHTCAPCSGTFTITVKQAGLASSWLHEHMMPGKTLLFRGIQVDD